eukprot:5694003-Amphidinium_carterae.1
MSCTQKVGLVKESLACSMFMLGSLGDEEVDRPVDAPILDTEAWRDPGNDKFVDEYTGEDLPETVS